MTGMSSENQYEDALSAFPIWLRVFCGVAAGFVVILFVLAFLSDGTGANKSGPETPRPINSTANAVGVPQTPGTNQEGQSSFSDESEERNLRPALTQKEKILQAYDKSREGLDTRDATQRSGKARPFGKFTEAEERVLYPSLLALYATRDQDPEYRKRYYAAAPTLRDIAEYIVITEQHEQRWLDAHPEVGEFDMTRIIGKGEDNGW